jgi:hypothetical protein
MADDGTLSVDIDSLQRGGVRLQELGAAWKKIHGALSAVQDEYGHQLGGDGPIGNSFNASYYPGADAAMEFLDGLGDLVDTHGGKTKDLGDLFNDVNTATTEEAGGRSGGRH